MLDNLNDLRYYMSRERNIAFVEMMGYRSTVGQLILDQSIEVRILVPQPHEMAYRASSKGINEHLNQLFFCQFLDLKTTDFCFKGIGRVKKNEYSTPTH